MEKETRSAIERTTLKARRLLEQDFAAQLESTFDVLLSGAVAPTPGTHLSARDVAQREVVVAAIEHKRAAGMKASDAVADYLRDAAFTSLNRFAALKMLEARGLVQECISMGEQSAGYREFCGMAPGIALLPDGAGYRLYVESLFDELSTEIKVMFDRRDPASVLWPRRTTFGDLLNALNAPELSGVWADDETIGWIYQYFNSGEERRKMREQSQAPRNSRELAVRNQFFTPRYVVEFLVDNTLGRTWLEMHGQDSRLMEQCRYFVRLEGEAPRDRPRKDPRDLRILDPACGSGHFLLYAFDLLLTIYEEAWAAEDAPRSESTGRMLREDHPHLTELRRAAPALIVEHNLHGVDIDPRAAQIAALALWLRAQRAWKDLGVQAAQRPRISRTHIVIAEPMPGDEALVEDFATRLDPPLLRDLFRKMVAEMRLAGELGTLLPIDRNLAAELTRAREQFVIRRHTAKDTFLPGLERDSAQTQPDRPGVDDHRFFDEAEARLLGALREFTDEAVGGASVRRLLFADDASQGIALVDLVRRRFDVVLMNPPFGLSTIRSKRLLREQYPNDWTDLYAAFVRRALQLCYESGCVGAITSNLWLSIKRQEDLRRRLSTEASLRVVADLGGGVLDDATVDTTAFVVDARRPSHSPRVGYCRPRDICIEPTHREFSEWQLIDLATFQQVPSTPFCFALGQERLSLWSKYSERLDPDLVVAFKGNATFDNFRFLRCWWELASHSVGRDWVRYDKGGEYQPFFNPTVLVWKFRSEAAENRAFQELQYGTDAQVMQSVKHWLKGGLCYSRACMAFSPRILAAGHVVNDMSIALLPRSPDNTLAILALLASTHVEDLLRAFGDYRKIEKGAVASLPLSSEMLSSSLASSAAKGVRASWCLEATRETSPVFMRPGREGERATAIGEVDHALLDIDEESAAALFGMQQQPVSTAKSELTSRVLTERFPCSPEDIERDRVSYCVGLAFGRWSHEALNRGLVQADLTSSLPLNLPPAPPGMWGTPCSVIDLRPLDEGHGEDLATAVCEAMDVHFGGAQCDAVRAVLQWKFFSEHLSAYSQSGRVAPIYWQLGSPSGGYSVWVYSPAVTRDTLFKLQNEYVGQRLSLEERRAAALRESLGPLPAAAVRKDLTAHTALIEELRWMLDEIKRVAPLWNPNLDDGIVLTMAPLWRLVPQHKAWQKELKGRWDDLVAGNYDWAHIAMHLWPERVVPKCATDRSLAIAHGLEHSFWVEGADGKWKRRPKPTRPVEELVRERSSPAVKVALKGLLEAPAPSGTSKNVRRGRADA